MLYAIASVWRISSGLPESLPSHPLCELRREYLHAHKKKIYVGGTNQLSLRAVRGNKFGALRCGEDKIVPTDSGKDKFVRAGSWGEKLPPTARWGGKLVHAEGPTSLSHRRPGTETPGVIILLITAT